MSLVGTMLGSYRILSLLGEGGMGAVYLGEHQTIARKAAIKVLHEDFAGRPAVVQRFFNEARAANLIQHQNIVDVYDFGESPGVGAFIVMEYLAGESLAARLRLHPTLPLATVARLVQRVASALGAAHARGIVHRDLKPDNIFLVPDADNPGEDRVKVLDFGIAKLTDESGPGSVRTRTGAVLGTPVYMSPEQCHGSRNVDHRSDVYALGIIAYEALAGQPPFVADGFGPLVAMHLGVQPPPLRGFNARVPEAVERVILRALAKEPGERFQSMEELSQALRAAVSDVAPSRPVRTVDEPASLAATSPGEEPLRPPTRGPAPAATRGAGTPKVQMRTPRAPAATPALATPAPAPAAPPPSVVVDSGAPERPDAPEPPPSKPTRTAPLPAPPLQAAPADAPQSVAAPPASDDPPQRRAATTTLSAGAGEEDSRLLPARKRTLAITGASILALAVIAAVAAALSQGGGGEPATAGAEDDGPATDRSASATGAPDPLAGAREKMAARDWSGALAALDAAGATGAAAEALRNTAESEREQEKLYVRFVELSEAGDLTMAFEMGVGMDRTSTYWSDIKEKWTSIRSKLVAAKVEFATAAIAARDVATAAKKIEEAKHYDPEDARIADLEKAMAAMGGSAASHAGAPVTPPATAALAPVEESRGAADDAKEEYTKGLRLFAAGHEPEAMAAFKKSIKVDPKFPDPHRALGTIYARQGNLRGMCKEFGTYITLNPHAGDAAKIGAEMKKYDSTIPACRR
ncbi:MAG TPA: protein kinase [Myxococcota bacterium]|jgi:serine/threonine-protein kinase|nr:protein kinase [Myxococcota bacterium]